jgi:hypothetical protein
MAWVSYIARRQLAPSHFAGTTYSLPLRLTEITPPSGGALKTTQESMDGSIETLYFGRRRVWGITLAPVQIHLAAELYEFLESTDDGQLFTFDPYGSEEVPVRLLNVMRADDGYTESTFQREGKGGHTDWVTLGFTVREQ